MRYACTVQILEIYLDLDIGPAESNYRSEILKGTPTSFFIRSTPDPRPSPEDACLGYLRVRSQGKGEVLVKLVRRTTSYCSRF